MHPRPPRRRATAPRRTPGRSPSAPDGAGEALQRALERVGDRWVLRIVEVLLDGPRRFGELAEVLGVAPNILSKRIRQLEADGVVVAAPYNDRPVRLSYELTASGRELAGAVALLAAWGARRDGRPAATFHARCGTALEIRPWCPTCDRTVDEGEAPGVYEV